MICHHLEWACCLIGTDIQFCKIKVLEIVYTVM
jgi:hypothetical protein